MLAKVIAACFSWMAPQALLCKRNANPLQMAPLSRNGLKGVKAMVAEINTPKIWQAHLPQERHEQNKYSRGHVLIIAGNEMVGASKLAAMAARRMGAGLVTVMAEEAHRQFFLAGAPGLLFVSSLTEMALKDFCQERKVTALVVGQGLGKNEGTQKSVLAALACRVPTVVDAEGLTAFAQDPKVFIKNLHERCILTPHEGEFLTFFKTIIGHSKPAATQLAAHKTGAVVVHKGPETLIATGTEAVRNQTSAPLLATAGSGDVLAGVIGALLAKRMPPLYAACAAVWVHSEAGKNADFGLIAEDLPSLCAQKIAPFVTIN